LRGEAKNCSYIHGVIKNKGYMNLGYACINTIMSENGIMTNRTMRKKTFQEKGFRLCFRFSIIKC
jgi:cell division GTPase FtsZ